MVKIIRILLFCCCSFIAIKAQAQCNCDSIRDVLSHTRICVEYSPYKCIVGPFHTLFYPKDTFLLVSNYSFEDCLRICDDKFPYPIFKLCSDGEIQYHYHLNGLELPLDTIEKLDFSKTWKKDLLLQCVYSPIFNDKMMNECILGFNLFLTTFVPIYLNGTFVPFEQCKEVLSLINPENIVSVQRVERKYRRRNDRIDVITN